MGAGNQCIHALRVTETVQNALAYIGAIGLPNWSSRIGLVVATRLK